MKQELLDIAKTTPLTSAPSTVIAFWSNWSVTEWFAAIIFALQAAYLVRKWWREETEWGMKLRRWAERSGLSKPAPLGKDTELDE